MTWLSCSQTDTGSKTGGEVKQMSTKMCVCVTKRERESEWERESCCWVLVTKAVKCSSLFLHRGNAITSVATFVMVTPNLTESLEHLETVCSRVLALLQQTQFLICTCVWLVVCCWWLCWLPWKRGSGHCSFVALSKQIYDDGNISNQDEDSFDEGKVAFCCMDVHV